MGVNGTVGRVHAEGKFEACVGEDASTDRYPKHGSMKIMSGVRTVVLPARKR